MKAPRAWKVKRFVAMPAQAACRYAAMHALFCLSFWRCQQQGKSVHHKKSWRPARSGTGGSRKQRIARVVRLRRPELKAGVAVTVDQHEAEDGAEKKKEEQEKRPAHQDLRVGTHYTSTDDAGLDSLPADAISAEKCGLSMAAGYIPSASDSFTACAGEVRTADPEGRWT